MLVKRGMSFRIPVILDTRASFCWCTIYGIRARKSINSIKFIHDFRWFPVEKAAGLGSLTALSSRNRLAFSSNFVSQQTGMAHSLVSRKNTNSWNISAGSKDSASISISLGYHSSTCWLDMSNISCEHAHDIKRCTTRLWNAFHVMKSASQLYLIWIDWWLLRRNETKKCWFDEYEFRGSQVSIWDNGVTSVRSQSYIKRCLCLIEFSWFRRCEQLKIEKKSFWFE